jgi:hypothetical protein
MTMLTAATTNGDRRAVANAVAADVALLGIVADVAQLAEAQERRRQLQRAQQVQQRQTVVVHVHNHINTNTRETRDVEPRAETRRAAPMTPPSIPHQRTREQVRSVLVSQMPDLGRCQSLLPPISGGAHRAYCRFRIQPDGTPVGIELRVHEPKPLRECVEQVIGQWRFPEATMSTSVSLPLAWPVAASQ